MCILVTVRNGERVESQDQKNNLEKGAIKFILVQLPYLYPLHHIAKCTIFFQKANDLPSNVQHAFNAPFYIRKVA